MTRLGKAALALAFAAAAGPLAAQPPSPRPALDRPNIVLIMADDVGWEVFPAYGGEDYRTPRLDAIAAEGVRFEHCYATPLCTTSRVQIMTGQYNFRNYTHFGYLSAEERTFGHLAREAGYATAVAGKWQLNGIYNELPGHEERERPVALGFDEYSLWQLTRGRRIDEGGGERFWSPPIETNGRFVSIEENAGLYGPDLFCDFLCDFMERHRDRPFLVYYPMVLVHDPFVPTPRTIGEAPRDHSANREPRDPADKKANFVAMVEYMDEIIGRLVDRIDALGLAENTIVLFTADNGTHPKITSRWRGVEVQGGKGGLTDTGTRVPLYARWKGTAPEGAVLEDLVDFTDFLPTIAEALGLSGDGVPFTDGRSFLPQLRGEPGEPRRWALNHYQPYWNREPGQWVRDAEYKLYRDGRFYHVPEDLDEARPLEPGAAGDAGEAVRRYLQSVIERCPPVPEGPLGRDAPKRPVHPDWPSLHGD